MPQRTRVDENEPMPEEEALRGQGRMPEDQGTRPDDEPEAEAGVRHPATEGPLALAAGAPHGPAAAP